MGNNRGAPQLGAAEDQLQQQHSFTQHSEAARKSGHSQGADRAAAPAGAGEHPSSNGGNDHGEVQSSQKTSKAVNLVSVNILELKQDPSVAEGDAPAVSTQPEPSESEPTAHDTVADADMDAKTDGPPHRSSRRTAGGGDADTAHESGHQLRSSSRLAARQQDAQLAQQQQQQQEFAFRPTRPRTKGSQRPRGNLHMANNSGVGSEPITPHGPTSGLDSLACAAAWELGEEEDTNMEHPTTTARSSGRETDDGQGEYLYDDDVGEGEVDYDDEEEEEEEEEDDEEGGGRRGGRHADSRGPAAGTRSASGSRRPCPRRGGAPRPRDPSAESGQEEAGLVFAATSGRPELEKCPPDMFEADLVGFLTARGERQLAAHVREKRITCNSLPLDIYGLYKEVVKRGGYIANERYDDKGSRWTGTINFAGDIFPRLKNWTANNRATSVGSQLLNNYRKFLLAYERAYTRMDLPNSELAVQQRAAAATAPNSIQAQAAAIQAAAIAAAKQNQPWEAPEPALSNPPPAAAPPPHRRSAAGSTSAGTKRTSHAAPAAAAAAERTITEPGNSWQRGGRDIIDQHDTAEAMEDEMTDMQPVQHGGPMLRASSWAGDRSAEGSGLLSGSKRRRHASSADGTPATALPMPLPLPLPVSVTSPPTMRKIEHMQQQWTSAHMQVWSSGQAYPSPGSILLVQDPGQPTLQWVVVAADLGDLPLEVAEGGRLPTSPTPQAPRLPMRLMEVSPAGRLEDATPVLLLGSNAMGWVSRLACRPPTAEALQNAMAAAWMRIASGAPGTTDAEQACVRGLKLALELVSPSAGMPGGMTSMSVNNMMMQPGAAIPAAKNLVQATAVGHTARQLLQLEGAMCPNGVTATAPSYWQNWRDMVSRADSPASLIAQLLVFTHQLSPAHLSAPLDMLWQELLPLLGLKPPLNAASSSSGGTDQPMLVTGAAGEATCLGVDLAVGLLRANIDWISVQRVWGSYLMTCQLPSASTPMGMMGMVGNSAGGWGMNMGPMTTPTPMPTPNTLGSNPINVVDRSRSSNDNAGRRPLPPVGPTAPPPSGPVGAGFSARLSTQSGAGLPPRPPPVRVTSGMGGPNSAGNTGSGTGGALSPTSQQQNLSLSPLRLVSGSGAAPGGGAMPGPAMDVKPEAAGNQGHMNLMQGQGGRASDMGATNSRVSSPQASERGEQAGGVANTSSGPAHHPMMMMGAGSTANTMVASGAAGLSSNTVTPLTSPGMQGNAVVFGNPPAGPLAPISAVPLDLSAPGGSSGAASQFGPCNSSASTFGGPPGMMMPGGMMGMGGGLQLGPMGGMMPPHIGAMGLMSPTGQAGGPRGPGNMSMMSLPSPQTNQGVITSPPAVPAQQPIVVRDQSHQSGAGPNPQGSEGGMHGMQAPQPWGGPMDGMMMGPPQAGPMQMGMMGGMPQPGQQHFSMAQGMPGQTLQLGTNPMLLPNPMGPMGQQMPQR